MARLGTLVSKEVRELLRERLVLVGLIIMPAIIMAVLGGLQGVAVKKSVQEAVKPLKALIAFDAQPSSSDLELARTIAEGLHASLYPGVLQGNPSRLLVGGNYSVVIVFHRGVAANFSEGIPVAARVYVLVPAPTPTAQALAARVASQVEAELRAIVAARVQEVFPKAKPSFLVSPLHANVTLVVWGREVPASRYTGYIVALYAIPVALLILLTSAAQVGAISIGLEREAKTIEMLLASPVTHGEVVLSKILGVLLVTLMGGASFSLGFLVYYASVKAAFGAAGGSIPLGLTGATVAAALATLILDLYIAAVLGLIFGLGAQDVRGAQMVANYFSFLLLIPYFIVFTGYPAFTGALGWALLADPLYPPLLALLGAQFGKAGLVVASLGVQVAHALAWTAAAFRLLEPERLVAGVPFLKRLAARRGRFSARSA